MGAADYSRDFDWSILTVPDPTAMVRGQLGFPGWCSPSGSGRSTTRPTSGSRLPVRGRSAREIRLVRSTSPGLGDWVLEWPGEGDPERLRKIGWLISHLTDVWASAWQEGLAGLGAEQVFTVGLSQATEIDQQAPFGHLVLHVNRELMHHGAEITFLLDLHRARPT